MTVEFKKRHGAVILVDEQGYILTSYHTLAFCFDKDTGTVFNYGEDKKVQEWYEESKITYITAGYPEMALNLTVISAEGYQWNLRDINAFIHTTGYLLKWYRKMAGVELSEPVKLLKIGEVKDAEVL